MQEVVFLQRISYGALPSAIAHLKKIGLNAYLEEQLTPSQLDEKILQQQFESFQLPVRYKRNGRKVEEKWAFKYLKAQHNELWKIALNRKTLSHQEKRRPSTEVVMATWLRAVYSKAQLQEIVVNFWHNHFNISLDAHDAIPILLPNYDRTIRKHCFGNFRTFLEAVAKSPCMLYYLDNALSKASPANENYARELFELHTLGASNYLNHLYNRWKEVPGSRWATR